MEANRSLFGNEFQGMDTGDFDPEDDAMPTDMLKLSRVIDTPDGRKSVLEAHITKTNEDTGVSWIKFYEVGAPEKYTHCFVDTIDPELILNAIENYIREGRGPAVAQFLREEGRVAMSPVIFRVKLDTVLGGNDLVKDMEGLF